MVRSSTSGPASSKARASEPSRWAGPRSPCIARRKPSCPSRARRRRRAIRRPNAACGNRGKGDSGRGPGRTLRLGSPGCRVASAACTDRTRRDRYAGGTGPARARRRTRRAARRAVASELVRAAGSSAGGKRTNGPSSRRTITTICPVRERPANAAAHGLHLPCMYQTRTPLPGVPDPPLSRRERRRRDLPRPVLRRQRPAHAATAPVRRRRRDRVREPFGGRWTAPVDLARVRARTTAVGAGRAGELTACPR